MNRSLKQLPRVLLASAALAVPATGLAAATAVNTVGAGGHDLVSYHTGAKPLPGNGNHVAVHDGVTYLFSSEANLKEFESKPEKYLPAYGGYCAYGVSVGKKFVGDPDVWEIVDGRLYLNLDNKVKGLWIKDVPGNVTKASRTWPNIRDKLPSEL